MFSVRQPLPLLIASKRRITENNIFGNQPVFGDSLLALQDVTANKFAVT